MQQAMAVLRNTKCPHFFLEMQLVNYASKCNLRPQTRYIPVKGYKLESHLCLLILYFYKGSGKGPVAGSCAQGNEISGSRRGGKLIN
jgi:hypothetical protein